MKTSFDISGMTCSACSAAVERAVKKQPGVRGVSVSLLTNSMTVEGTFADSDIILAVAKAGYSAAVAGKKEYNAHAAEMKNRLTVLIISTVLVLVVMYFSMGDMIGLPVPDMLVSAIISAVGSAAVMAINYKYFVSGVRSAVHLSPNMDTLIALGSAVSFIFGVYSTVMLGLTEVGSAAHEAAMNGLFFDSAAMILMFVDIGKFLEALGKKKTVSALDALIKLRPLYATIEDEEGERLISAAMLKPGDIVLVKSGETVPADGVIVSGQGAANESAITGEPLPAEKDVGGEVIGGTLLTFGFIKVRLTKTGDDTAIAKIIKTVEEAAASKAPISRIADRVSGIFVPVVIGIALAVFLVWVFIAGPVAALTYAASVLVISCPCALGLATPVAITVGLGRAAKQGILIKNAAALETVGKTEIMAFDKTGTITEGTPVVTECVGEAEMLPLIVAVESLSSHPLSAAITQYGEEKGAERLEATDFDQFFGGISGKVGERTIIVGNAAAIKGRGIDISEYETDQGGGLYAAVDGRAVMRFIVADRIKQDSAAAIDMLHGMGIKTIMLTGDGQANAVAVGESAGIGEVMWSLSPQDKADRLAQLSGQTAFVGDGINDAPALTVAGCGIAIGAGTDVAIDAADIVISGDKMTAAAQTVKLSRRVMRVIKQNLFWAFFYNALCIPLAGGAFAALGVSINPMIASAAMSISSLFVVGNSLRLMITKKQKQEVKKMKKVTIKGMSCEHCSTRVKKTLVSIGGGEVSVDLKSGVAMVSGQLSDEQIKQAIEDAGYEVVSIE